MLFCSCVFSLFSSAITLLGEERELILVLFVRLFDLHSFGFVCYLFILVSGKGCGLSFWHFLVFSLTYMVYKFRKIVGKPQFTDHFSKIIICYKWKGYNNCCYQISACLAINRITVYHFAYLLNFTPMGRDSDSVMAQLKSHLLDSLGRNLLCLFLGSPRFNWWFPFCSNTVDSRYLELAYLE